MSGRIHVGDVGTYIGDTIKDQDGVVVDLTNATLTLEITKPDGTVVNKTGNSSNPTGGLAEYTVQAADNLWSAAGNYVRRWIVTWPDGRRFTSSEVSEYVEA